MADEIVGGNGSKEKENEQKPIVLTITLDPVKGLNVSGPGNGQLYDEAMCDYLMKKAGRHIEAHNARTSAPRIQQPNSRQMFRGGFGKRH